MSSEKEQVKAEELEPVAEESGVELKDSELEEVAGGTMDAEEIAERSNKLYGR